MGEFTTIMARDGHEFQAWLAAPAGRPRGALVVVQEIFGVNGHIRAVTDGFAAAGYTAIASGRQAVYAPRRLHTVTVCARDDARTVTVYALRAYV